MRGNGQELLVGRAPRRSEEAARRAHDLFLEDHMRPLRNFDPGQIMGNVYYTRKKGVRAFSGAGTWGVRADMPSEWTHNMLENTKLYTASPHKSLKRAQMKRARFGSLDADQRRDLYVDGDRVPHQVSAHALEAIHLQAGRRGTWCFGYYNKVGILGYFSKSKLMGWTYLFADSTA